MPTAEAIDGRRPPVSELSLSEEIFAWNQKREDLEKARAQLFEDGEVALAKGLIQLGQEAKGIKMTV